MATSPAPVLIVRSGKRKRNALRDLLARHAIATCEVATGKEAWAAVMLERPALVLLDVELEDVAGYELCRQLREEYGDGLPIIFLSASRTSSMDRIAGLLIGADDYVSEPYDPDELVARVWRFLRRSNGMTHGHAEATRTPASLTERECEVLEMLAAGQAQPAIARTLVISPKTVSTHIQRILTKLGVHSRVEAVAHAYRNGLVPGGREYAGRPRPDAGRPQGPLAGAAIRGVPEIHASTPRTPEPQHADTDGAVGSDEGKAARPAPPPALILRPGIAG